MDGVYIRLAFIGPGGPEFLVVMLVLLMMFGAKDAPRILRRLNEIINQIRNTADGFKREIMYGDLSSDSYAEPPGLDDEFHLDEEFQELEAGGKGEIEDEGIEDEDERESGDDVSKA